MKKYYLLLLICCCGIAGSMQAQYSRYIIRFTDKKGTGYSLSNPSAYLSTKAIARRTRYHVAIDSTDLPLSAAYVDSIRKIPNVTILNTSKWLNQLCIKTTDGTAIGKITSLPFVVYAAPVAPRVIAGTGGAAIKKETFKQLPTPLRSNYIAQPAGFAGTLDALNYGNNAGQVHIHKGEFLHNLGFRGQGMTIAMLDAGFYNYNNNPAFDSLRLQNQVLGTWDYVASEQSVTEDNTHGAYCLSIMAANEPGKIVGTAPKAKYWLLRTEDAATEYPVEEQNWVAAAEFADSAGVDIITSSLGYSDFDNHAYDHSYAQRDGKTSMISIGASLAVKKGLLVTNSAGNSGGLASDAKFVICPADAPAVFTIGSTDVNGAISYFSSWGPNGAGQLKPNVVSVGGPAVAADVTTGNPVTGNGTSFSNPNLCGLIACLWQAFPEFSNTEITDAVQRSASRYSTPDNRYGYGIPDMEKAYLDLQQQRTVRNYQQLLGDGWIKAWPVPFSQVLNVAIKSPITGTAYLKLTDINGKTLEIKTVSLQQDQLYTINFSKVQAISRGIYTVQYNDGKNKRSLRVVKM
ncbi:MAG TPA: S8 family serine peptidase [Chitinophagaceae bacterium]|nr:S8 family serine peptidase [Chitinophagaceae bacterium]